MLKSHRLRAGVFIVSLDFARARARWEVGFDLDKELKKGEAEYSIRSLFAITPFAVHQFSQIGPQIGAEALMRIIYEKGIKEAISRRARVFTISPYVDFPFTHISE